MLVSKKNIYIALALVTTLSGCVTMTAPVPMGEGRYLITLNARGGFTGDGELLAQTVARANEFCLNNSQSAEIIDTKNSGVQMWTPQNNQVVFRCVPLKK